MAPTSSDLNLSIQILVHKKIDCQVHLYAGYSISTAKNSFTQFLDECGRHIGIGGTNVCVQKAHYAKICVNVSQFGCTGLGTSASAQLTRYKNSATDLVIASSASFQPPLAEFFSAVFAFDRPPAVPDLYSSATLPAFDNFYPHAIGYQHGLVHHSEYGVWPISILAEPTIQTSSSLSSFLMDYGTEFVPSRVPCLALLGGEISPPHLLLLLLMQVSADDGELKKFHPWDSFAPEDLYPFDTFVPDDFLATQPKKFYPLDSFAPKDLDPLDTFDSEDLLAIQQDPIALALAIAVPSPISHMDKESLLDKPKLAQFDCIAVSLAYSHLMPV